MKPDAVVEHETQKLHVACKIAWCVQQKTCQLLSNCTVKLTYLAPVAAMAVLVSGTLHATDSDVSSANELVRTVLENEMRAEDQDHSHWMYRLEKDQPTKRQIKEVVETEEGLVERLISLNGRPLSAVQQQEDARIERLLHDPTLQEKQRRERQKDAEQARNFLKMLPDAFNFTYARCQGDLVQFDFKPNPNFRPPNREARVFHAMAGSMSINVKDNRLAAIEGKLMQEVKFGGGFLGHLDKGGRFAVRQQEIAPGHWDVTLLDVEMQGKALFFKTINVQDKEIRSYYQRVPDNLTLEQAAELLRHRINEACRQQLRDQLVDDDYPGVTQRSSPMHSP